MIVSHPIAVTVSHPEGADSEFSTGDCLHSRLYEASEETADLSNLIAMLSIKTDYSDYFDRTFQTLRVDTMNTIAGRPFD